MKRLIVAASILLITAVSAMADDCKTNAVGKDSKPLVGAAQTSFLKKCRHDACDAKAVSGTDSKKKLTGAAYNSFMTKCEKDAATS